MVRFGKRGLFDAAGPGPSPVFVGAPCGHNGEGPDRIFGLTYPHGYSRFFREFLYLYERTKGGTKMQARVDPDLCTGCELCVTTCPEVFEMEDDKAIVKTDSVPAEAMVSCRQATEECPVEAIIIEE